MCRIDDQFGVLNVQYAPSNVIVAIFGVQLAVFSFETTGNDYKKTSALKRNGLFLLKADEYNLNCTDAILQL